MSSGHQITEAEADATIADPLWRMRNLYTIRDKQGHVIPFRPNWVQEQLIHARYVDGCRRFLVLKSRRHGVSTVFELMGFDECYFGENIQMSILDLTAANAEEKLKNFVKFAWENLSTEIREGLKVDNNSMLEFANGSIVNAGKQARGGQNQILHISEWGPIAHKDPKRSEEIKTGALPSADEGVIFNESTFKGGKGGDFYSEIERAKNTPDDQRTAKDYRLFFFGWYQDPRNTLEGNPAWIDKATATYLARLEEKLRITLTNGQKVWYWKTKQEQGIFMFQEYPSTVEEALSAPVEGAIFAALMMELRELNRVTTISRDRAAPCFASWDIGWGDEMSVWLFQMIGRDAVWLWHRSAKHETMAQMHEAIEKTGIPVSAHVLPHDGKNGNVVTGPISPKVALEKAGAQNVIIVPQAKDEWSPIDLARDYLARSWFNHPDCLHGLNALDAYHTADVTNNGVLKKDPVHDWSSHPCKALIYGCMAMKLGLLKPSLARQLEIVPRTPEGDVIVDLEHIRQRSMLRRSGLAKSGTRRR